MNETSVFEDLAGYRPTIFNKPIKPDYEEGIQGFMQRIKEEGFDLTEMSGILQVTENQLIVSGAGSGKTTVLLFIVQMDIIRGISTKVVKVGNTDNMVKMMDNVLVCTFLATGASDLQQRLQYWQQKMGYATEASNITFSTLHAEFLKVLREIGIGSSIITFEEMRNITRQVCKTYDIRNNKTDSLKKEDFKVIEGMFTYSRNRLDDKKYVAEGMGDYNLSPVILERMIAEAKNMRRTIGKIDFEDMQEILLSALQSNPNLATHIENKYSVLYIDEFQDTSQIQYEILKYYTRKAKRVVAIGDDDQSIYKWRGSDIEIIRTKFKEDFKPVVSNLSTNYRCPSNILNPVIPSICRNDNRYEKNLKSYIEGGELKLYLGQSKEDYWQIFYDNVKEDMQKNRTVAILVRTNFNGLIPAFMLETQKLYSYSISSTEMTGDSKLTQDIVNLVSLFMDRTGKRLENSLALLVGRDWKAKRGVQTLCSILNTNYKLSIWNIDREDLATTVPLLLDTLDFCKVALEGTDANKEVLAYIRLLNYVWDNIYSGDNAYCENARTIISFLIGFIEERQFANLETFEETFRCINKELHAHIKNVGARIQISTVHEAKGKEWDSVYIWDDTQGVFPSDRDIDDETYEEERRVHYIAWTRARQSLKVLSVVGRFGDFLSECNIPAECIHYSSDYMCDISSSYAVTDLYE